MATTIEASDAFERSKEKLVKSAGGRIMIAGLIFTGALCTLDRMALSLVTDAMRGDLGITDTQVGVIQGLSFAILFSIVGIPLGLLTDRVARGKLLASAVVVWTIGTIGCGLAPNFQYLFASRMLVGAGEAAFWPVVISVVGDLAPNKSRGAIIGRVIIGQLLGSSVSLILGGQIMRFGEAGGFGGIPLLGDLAPWRNVFVIYGAAGLIGITLLVLGLEPPREERAEQTVKPGPFSGLAEFGIFYRKNWVVVSAIFGISILVATASHSSIAWSVPMFLRRFNFSPQEVGLIFGLMTLACGALGSVLAGYVTRKTTSPAIRCNVISGTYLLYCVKVVLIFNPTVIITFGVSALSSILTALGGVIKMVIFQDVIPSHLRGITTSIMHLLTNLVGASLGPILVGAMTQHVFQDDKMVGVSLGLVIVPAMLGSALLVQVVRVQLSRANKA